MKRFLQAAVTLLALAMPAAAQLVTITASNMGAGAQPAGAVWTFCMQPTGVPGKGFMVGSGGQATGQQVCRDVAGGVILTTLGGVTIGPMLTADTNLSSPQNLCYVATLRDVNGAIILGGNAPYSGYGCVQPAANNSWCSSGTCDFDDYTPNIASLPLGPTLPYLTVGMLDVTTCIGCSAGIGVTSAPYYASGSVTTTTTVGSTAAGTSVVVSSASTWTVGEGIYIAGAGAGAANYVGTVTAISGANFTISPATSTIVAHGTLVQHDDTAAFQSAITALAASGGSISIPSGYYRMNAPQQTVNGLSTILALPTIVESSGLNSNPFITVQLSGQQEPTVNLTTSPQGGVVLDTDENTGNFIGGAGAGGTFTGVYLSLKNLVVRTPQNPAIMAINANHVGGLHLENVIVDVAGEGSMYSAVPTHSNGIGIVAPAPGSGNLSLFENLKIFGYYTGIELFDHAYLHYAAFGFDKYAVLIGNGASGSHAIGGNYVDVEQCLYGISPYSTVGGSFNITNYDFEHDAGAFAVVGDLYDPTNLLSGSLSYGGTIGAGGTPLNLAISGAVNVQLTTLSAAATNAQLGGLSWTSGSVVGDPTGGIDASVAVSQIGQVLTVTPPGGFAAPGVVNGNGYTSATISNFTGHKFSVRMVPVVLGVAGAEEVYPYIAMGASWTQNVYIYPYEGTLYFVKNDGSFSVIGSESYNPASYPLVRIREASGTLYGETSPDGITWTNGLGSTTVGWSYNSGVSLSIGVAIVPSYTTPTYPGYVQFDQVAVQ
jgi:hypothetical protein